MSEGIDRRDFLVRGALAGAGLIGAGWLASVDPKALADLAADTAPSAAPNGSATGRSRVGLYTSESWLGSDAKPTPEKTLAMLDKGMMLVFGTDSAEQAWKQVACPQDVVALKVNCECRYLCTNPVVSYAIAQRLMDVGVPPQNIILFDFTSRQLSGVGYELVSSGTAKPYCYGTDGDYSDPFSVGTFQGRLSNILVKKATVLINLPALKHHALCQVTMALKNHFGTVDNPGALHPNIDMHIPSVNATEPIKTKTRLIVLDASRGCFNGGPQPPPGNMWNYQGLAVATDPVALDFVGNRIIADKRTAMGLGPMSANPGDVATHLLNAAQMGLGKASEAEIDLVCEQVA